jgi:hypothetical protein
MGETALTTIQRMFSETTRDTDHCRFNEGQVALKLGPFAAIEAVEGATADKSKCPAPSIWAA